MFWGKKKGTKSVSAHRSGAVTNKAGTSPSATKVASERVGTDAPSAEKSSRAANLANTIVGNLETLTAEEAVGWALDVETPAAAVAVLVRVDGTVVARTVAETYRADLATAGYRGGKCAFAVKFNAKLASGAKVQVVVQSREQSHVLVERTL